MLAAIVVVGAFLVHTARAEASPFVQYGVQDDAWLLGGPGSFDERLDRARPTSAPTSCGSTSAGIRSQRRDRAKPSSHLDPAYRWDRPGRAPAGAPGSRHHACRDAGRNAALGERRAGRELGADEPELVRELRPRRRHALSLGAPLGDLERAEQVLAAAADERRDVHEADPESCVRRAEGRQPRQPRRRRRHRAARRQSAACRPWTGSAAWTAPARGSTRTRTTRIPSVACETPTRGGCSRLREHHDGESRAPARAGRARLRPKRIWLTEYGYQTNPPDRLLGVSQAAQARYLGEAALRAYRAPRVDMLIHFLVRDEAQVGRWQSGLFTAKDDAKLAAAAFPLPLARVSVRGATVTLWGQVRPGSGRQTYRLRYSTGGGWRWLGGTRTTNARGFFQGPRPAAHDGPGVLARPALRSRARPLSEGSAKRRLCSRAALLARGRVAQSRPYHSGYERSLRPCLGTTIAPGRRATFRQALLAERRVQEPTARPTAIGSHAQRMSAKARRSPGLGPGSGVYGSSGGAGCRGTSSSPSMTPASGSTTCSRSCSLTRRKLASRFVMRAKGLVARAERRRGSASSRASRTSTCSRSAAGR